MNDYEIQKIRDTAFCSGYNTAVSKYENKIAELEHQLIHRNCLDCSNHSSKLRMRTLELEQENAELKKKNLDTQDAVTMQMYTNKANKEIADKQLSKAKEIIKKLINACCSYGATGRVTAEAENFLSEVEK